MMRKTDATYDWSQISPWRLALLLVLAKMAFVAALLGEYALAAALFVSTGLVVLDLADWRRAEGKMQNA